MDKRKSSQNNTEIVSPSPSPSLKPRTPSPGTIVPQSPPKSSAEHSSVATPTTSLSPPSFRHYSRLVQVNAFKDNINPLVPFQHKGTVNGKGSAFFVKTNSKDNLPPRKLLTAAHVVANTYLQGGVKLWIPSIGKNRQIGARIVSFIPEIDCAVLELTEDIDPDVKVEAYELGNDRDLKQGEPLTVVGYPMGDDNVKVISSTFNGLQGGVIQLDGAINPGNSGGPVLAQGKVVGIVSSGYNPQVANNVAFAIPISIFRSTLPLHPFQTNESERPRILRLPSMGLMYHNSSESCTEIQSPECANGVTVQWVSKYSAFHGKIKVGDRICTISAREHGEENVDNTVTYDVDNFGEVKVPWYDTKIPLPHLIATIPVDIPVSIKVWKPDKRATETYTHKLTEAFRGGFKALYSPFETLEYESFGGIVVMPLRMHHFMVFPFLQFVLQPTEKEEEHLVVSYVLPNSKFAEYNVIRPGDLLFEVNSEEVRTLDQYRKVLGSSKGCVTWKNRKNATVKIKVKDLLESEPILSQTYGYPLSEVYKTLSR